MRLAKKVVILTGANGGIGRAAAERFLAEGASVMLADRDTLSLESYANTLASDAVRWIGCDVSSDDDNKAMVDATMAAFGRIDGFVANAGIEGKIGSIVDSDVGNLEQVLNVNVRGAWLGLHHVLPHLYAQNSGSVIITSSGAGVQGSPNLAPYNTSKHAVIGLMRCAALEAAAYNVRVNTVNPGSVETRMMRAIEDGFVPGGGSQFKDAILQATPLGRYADPEEIASMMVFLLSDDASYCTGSVYMVDGGNAT
jgi:NAD(P)-dependent dehydrogenase (short-subunit alcohol dehydrogenase family)